MHDVCHDLESVFWLLLWVVLRCAATTCYRPNEPYVTVFGVHTEYVSAAVKTHFLLRDMWWEVKDNEPLTMLLRDYKQACFMSIQQLFELKKRTVPLTYEAILALFDEALAHCNWPQHDHASPVKMRTDYDVPVGECGRGAGESQSRGSQERRILPDEEDPLSLPPHKRTHIYRRPVRNLVGAGGDHQATDNVPH